MSENNIFIKNYEHEDFKEVLELFKESIAHISDDDYTLEERNAWINGIHIDRFQHALTTHTTLLAIIDSNIVGFADIDERIFRSFICTSKVSTLWSC